MMDPIPKKQLQQKAGSPTELLLQPDTAPGDTPDFAEEFTTSGTEKNYWKNPANKENSKELLI
jgi:hypothetical protein